MAVRAASVLFAAVVIITLQICNAKKSNENLFGLTHNEVNNLRKAFKIFKSEKNSLEEIKKAFVMLFKTTPEAQSVFPTLVNIPQKDLEKSPELRDLAEKTLSYISGFMKQIDNTGKATLYLKFLKDVLKNNLESISDFAFNIYHVITSVNDRLAAVKYWKYWQVRKNAKHKHAALSKWKEAEKTSSATDTALMKILTKVDQMVGGLVMKNYFGVNPDKLEKIKQVWKNFTNDQGKLEKVILRTIQETPEILKLSPGIKHSSVGDMSDPKFKQLIENYNHLVTQCIESMESSEKSTQFVKHVETTFGKSKLQALKAIRKHLVFNPMWTILEKQPDLYRVMKNISQNLYIIIESQEKNLPLKLH